MAEIVRGVVVKRGNVGIPKLHGQLYGGLYKNFKFSILLPFLQLSNPAPYFGFSSLLIFT